MSDKPVSLQESFPEICETLKDDTQNDEVKSKTSNKTSNPDKVSYQLCQVLQDPAAPHRVTVVKESFSKQCKQSSCSDDSRAKSKRLIYCKEVVKPFIKQENGKSPDDLTYNAMEIIENEFPNFKYCCSIKGPESPKVKVESCTKKAKKCKKPMCQMEESCPCEDSDYCAKIDHTFKVAKHYIKDLCATTCGVIDKFNDICQTDTQHKKYHREPPPHPKCPRKPKGCSMEFPKRVSVVVVENPPVNSNSETQPKVTLLDKAFNVTKNAVETVAETKHYLTKFHSVHSLLLLPLDEIDNQEEEEPQKIEMGKQKTIIDESARQLDEQEQELKEEQEEENKLKKHPLDNLVNINDETNHKTYMDTKLISMTYKDDDGDDDDEGEIAASNKIKNKNKESPKDIDNDDDNDILFSNQVTRPSFFSGFIQNIKRSMPTANGSQNMDTGEDELDRFGEKVMKAIETTANTTITTLESITTASSNFIGKVYNDTTSQVSNAVFGSKDAKANEESAKLQLFSKISTTYDDLSNKLEKYSPDIKDTVVDQMINKYAEDKSSSYDVPKPKEVSASAKTVTEIEDIGYFSKLKSKLFSIFDDDELFGSFSRMSKPENMQDSFPEVTEAIKAEQVKNVQVKARYSNKTSEQNSEIFQLCQVLQDCKYPQKVTIIKETFIKCEKDPPPNSTNCSQNNENVPPVPKCCPKKTDLKSSMSYIYCKEIIHPYLDPDDQSDADELACQAVALAASEFPNFQYCCSVEKIPEPIMVNPNVLKNPLPPSKEPSCKDPISQESFDAGSSLVGAVCGATQAVASKAQSCLNSIFGKKENEDPPKKKK